MISTTLIPALMALQAVMAFAQDESVGERPYEMVWANRVEETRPPLFGFESVEGWVIECDQAEASWSLSQEQPLWGQHVAKLVYRATGPQPRIVIKPPAPLVVPTPIDCINIWVYGNNWGWAPDRSTPQVEIRAMFQGANGQAIPIVLERVRWKEWWLIHRRLTDEQLQQLGDRPLFAGFELLHGKNTDDRTLYFDNLAIYTEPLPPLVFEPRRQRPLLLPEGQTVGNNIGTGRLPFPTREETILPDNLTQQFRVSLDSAGDEHVFRYAGADGELVYRYRPETGTLSDITAQWTGRGVSFQPCVDGGVYFSHDGGRDNIAPESIDMIECKRNGNTVESTWRCRFKQRSANVTYVLRLWQKSLVIDIRCTGGEVGEFRIGRIVGLQDPRLVTLPYLVGAEQRPAIAVSGPAVQPLFASALLDHCRTNSSLFWFANRIADEGVTQNGGSRYLPKTDGKRNPCFERLFLTVSPSFAETLPNIPNPKSPWMHVAGERLWRAHGASDRQRDYEFWKRAARYGMTKVVITDHETGWRDGGESFTMRTRAAPRKGGDKGQADYAKKIRALGFRYGIYNNYTDYAPVNEHWDEDYVTRTPDNQWQTAWPRCYNPKPARAVEIESRLAPIIQQKFQLDTAYCDVHTAVRPWSYCDFDARVPGAGTFAATFYAYGEIMLHQKQTWNGPVYSEGNNHWYYCGLTDGNYGQDQVGQVATSPWLVDFDLLKMHPLCCNFGMGSPDMFYGGDQGRDETAVQREARLDRFLAATLAFGHTGFLVFEGGFENAVRSYYSLQQVHAGYAQETAQEIRYHDGQGNLVDTSAAVASGAYRRSQVMTRYANGLAVFVNGHSEDSWEVPAMTLPPNGWYVRAETGSDITAFSAMVDGHRADYVDSKSYIYANGRGTLTRFPKAVCDGQIIARFLEGGDVELIPVGTCEVFGVSLGGAAATAVALDEDGDRMGTAAVRTSRGLVYPSPIRGAVSYLLSPAPAPAETLTCDRTSVVPGERVEIGGDPASWFPVPVDAAVASQLWHNVGNRWIDFTVVPLVASSLRLADDRYQLEVTSKVGIEIDAIVRLGDASQNVRLEPRGTARLAFPRATFTHETVQTLPLQVATPDLTYRHTWWIKSEYGIGPVQSLSDRFESGQRLRGEGEKPADGQSLAVAHWTERTCGDEAKRCLFMHPPYSGGVGYTFALLEAIELPVSPAIAFRCEVGKADGSDPGDGILFRVAVVDETGEETMVGERSWIEHAWIPFEADLSRWDGQRIRIKLVTDVGPGDNSAGDWGCWANMRLESLQPMLITTVHDHPVELSRSPGPYPLTGLNCDDLRQAKRAVLHFQGIGLQNGEPYVSYATLNGVSLGPLPAAGGREGEGIWSDGEIVLPTGAIAVLEQWNHLSLRNPGQDSFKIGRFWLELELGDGRQASSQITQTVFTQPPSWPHAEGTGVPFGQDIDLAIRIPLEE